jgi:hypothetical protein
LSFRSKLPISEFLTIQKGKVNIDGTRTKNYHYACGGYINKGKSVTQELDNKRTANQQSNSQAATSFSAKNQCNLEQWAKSLCVHYIYLITLLLVFEHKSCCHALF